MDSFVKGDRVKRLSSGKTGVVRDAHIGSFSKYSNVVFDEGFDRELGYELCLNDDLVKVGRKLKKGDRVYFRSDRNDSGTVQADESSDSSGTPTARVYWDREKFETISYVAFLTLLEEAKPEAEKTGREKAIEGVEAYIAELKQKRAELNKEIQGFESHLQLLKDKK